jgi:hypothetical protein
MADGVALGRDAPHQIRMFRSWLADQEECRAHALLRQRRQHLRCGRRPRSVIEGQYDFMVVKR